MDTRIRAATIADAEAACQVVRRSIIECCEEDHHNDPSRLEAWLSNKTPDNVRTWVQVPGGFSVVAEVRDTVVGFAMCSSAGEVMLCYVAPEVRFSGVGKALIGAIEVHAAAASVHTPYLESTRAARTFYLNNGFAPSGPPAVAFGMEGHPMSKRVRPSSKREGARPAHLASDRTIPPPRAVVLFDGVCNVCNASVNFIIDRDPAAYFHFAALQSEAARPCLAQCHLPSEFLDGIVLCEEERCYTRSTAVLRILRRLGGFYRALYALILVPAFVRDAVYDWFIRRRYRWFGKRAECRLPTPEIQARFLTSPQR